MLIKDLLEISRDFPRGIAREEVELMIRYDGVLTTHPNDNQLVLSITIGCYTISVTHEEPNNLQLRKKFDAVSTILDDAGMLVVNDEKIALGAMGHFGRHSDESSRACKRRERCCSTIFRPRTKSGTPWKTCVAGCSLVCEYRISSVQTMGAP
jgi:hypothetical protein